MSNPKLNPREIFPASNYVFVQGHDCLGINTSVQNYPAYGNNLVSRNHKFRLFENGRGPNDVMYAQDQIRNVYTNFDLRTLELTYHNRTKDTRYDQFLRMQPYYVDIQMNPNTMYNNGVSRINQA
jgi:hypothetical protein